VITAHKPVLAGLDGESCMDQKAMQAALEVEAPAGFTRPVH